MHKLLERQLRKHFGADIERGPEFAAFVSVVDAAYRESDASRIRLERSIELTSTELIARNAQLQRDLAAIQRLELELRQAEKLRAVGQLAAGVAHEINTPIQYIGDSIHFVQSAFVELLKLSRRLQSNDGQSDAVVLEELRIAACEIDMDFLVEEVPKALAQTVEGVQRVSAIVSAMKDFGRADSREMTITDVNRCVESTLTVAHNEIRNVADVQLVLGTLPLIPCFPGELNQVLLNLLVNAAHAIAERQQNQAERGRIHLSTVHRGGRVVISVADDGAGIPLEHQGRIFEPFFTTKPVGAGTGQGLAIARSIVVEKHGGTLCFSSTPDVGTTFVISLPTGESGDEHSASAPQLRPEASA